VKSALPNRRADSPAMALILTSLVWALTVNIALLKIGASACE